MVSGTLSLPYSGYFSPFPHGTGSLSVSQEYLALTDGPASFTQGFTCPVILRITLSISRLARTGLSPSMTRLSCRFRFNYYRISWSYNPIQSVNCMVWALPRSLAATNRITFVFSSSDYLDVSVHRVRFPK